MIVVYATAAFVILELVSIIVEPLKLPEWLLPVVIVLLCVGFIIAIILSWIYDIHPEGGIVKTEPVHEVKDEENPTASNSWRIASYISFVVIIALIVLNIIPRTNQKKRKAILDKSIAVLPFINDSPDEEKMYFINGTMESILDNLCKIHDLRVVSRTSVEQYRNNLKPVQEIAKEMNVSYVLEGSGMKDEENIRLTIQLIDAIHDRHIWSDSYNRKTDEIFSLQSEIAQLVAGEIKAIVSPEEKQLIDKIPTSNLNAYDLYQKGREAQLIYQSDYINREARATAEALYRQSLQYDSTFAQAYLGLASICFSKLTWANDSVLNSGILDSALFYANTALSFDDQLADAYTFKGYYYRLLSETNQALKEWEKAISINPNSAGPYQGMGWHYFSEDDYVKSIESFVKASSLNRGPELPAILKDLGFALTSIGFFSNSKQQYQEALNLDGDTSSYYMRLSYVEFCAGNYAKAIEASQKAISKDSKDPTLWNHLGISYLHLGQYEESLYYFRKFTEELESNGRANAYSLPYVAYAFLQNGYTEESEIYVNEQINLSKEWLEGRISGFEKNYFRLALVYAFTGDKEKAYENLRLLKTGDISVNVMKYRNDPLFEKIRDEFEFQQIMNDLEAKYQAEHERVRKWLEENDML
ncbi:MAG: hypothetical protein MUO54_10250 [Anaerolineales bacterium]|nr:hypothetical protein [Anaerolineales bacterium]